MKATATTSATATRGRPWVRPSTLVILGTATTALTGARGSALRLAQTHEGVKLPVKLHGTPAENRRKAGPSPLLLEVSSRKHPLCGEEDRKRSVSLQCICTETGTVATESDCSDMEGYCIFDAGKNACIPTGGEMKEDPYEVLALVREMENGPGLDSSPPHEHGPTSRVAMPAAVELAAGTCAGIQGSFPYQAWMQDFAHKPLDKLTLLGSHDAGCYLDPETLKRAGGKDIWTYRSHFPNRWAVTQKVDLTAQMCSGYRVFDIRLRLPKRAAYEASMWRIYHGGYYFESLEQIAAHFRRFCNSHTRGNHYPSQNVQATKRGLWAQILETNDS